MKKIVILTSFYSLALCKDINKDDIFEADDEQLEKLKNAGIQFEDYIEDEKSLVELYNEDRNIIDTLNVKELKQLCKDLDIKFTKEDEVREHLKTMEVLEDK